MWKRAICVHIYRFPNIRCLFAGRVFVPYRQSVGPCARARIPRGVFYNIKDNPQGPRSTLLSRLGINKNELNVFFFFATLRERTCLFLSLSFSSRVPLSFPFEFYSGYIRGASRLFSCPITPPWIPRAASLDARAYLIHACLSPRHADLLTLAYQMSSSITALPVVYDSFVASCHLVYGSAKCFPERATPCPERRAT